MVDGKVVVERMSDRELGLNPVPDMPTILAGYVAAYRNSARGQAKIAERLVERLCNPPVVEVTLPMVTPRPNARRRQNGGAR